MPLVKQNFLFTILQSYDIITSWWVSCNVDFGPTLLWWCSKANNTGIWDTVSNYFSCNTFHAWVVLLFVICLSEFHKNPPLTIILDWFMRHAVECNISLTLALPSIQKRSLVESACQGVCTHVNKSSNELSWCKILIARYFELIKHLHFCEFPGAFLKT